MSARAGSASLPSSKLHAPDPRDHVEQPTLVQRLLDGRGARVVVLRAPAGWGKSTALAQWRLAETGRRDFAWVTLDRRDNDPARFWTYVIAALRRIAPELGAGSLPLLQAPGVDLSGEMLPALVDELTDLPAPVILALDGYEHIDTDRVGATVRALLELLPATVTVAVTAHPQVSLPVARLRERGVLLELGPADLRFSPAQARELCERVLMVDLPPAELARLTDRLEGWPAGLCLAAPVLATRTVAQRRAFLAAVPGPGPELAHRLVDDMLSAQPPAVREFMVSTSILERLSGPLCDAVTGGGEVSLAEVVASHPFYTPLGSDGRWYGRHSLLAPALNAALALRDPSAAADVHRRAADWHEARGLISDAVRHAIAGGALLQAGELIADHWAPTTANGAVGAGEVQAWLSGLPEAVVAQDLRLCVAGGHTALRLGDLEGAAQWLETARSAPLPAPFRDGFSSARGAVAGLRAGYRWRIGDVGAAMAAAAEMLAAEAPDSPWRTIGHAVTGLTAAASAQWSSARMSMEAYEELGRLTGQNLARVSGLAHVAAWSTEIGDWERARTAAADCLRVAEDCGLQEYWVCAGAHFARARLREAAGDKDAAKLGMRRAVMLARRGAGPVMTAWLLTHYVRVLVTCHDPAGAQRCLEQAVAALAGAPDAAAVGAMVAASARTLAAGAGTGDRAGVATGGPDGARHGAGPGADEALSARERDVLRLLATSLTRREIGAELFLTLNTVKAHTRSIFRKLDVSDRGAAVARARERGLI